MADSFLTISGVLLTALCIAILWMAIIYEYTEYRKSMSFIIKSTMTVFFVSLMLIVIMLKSCS